MFELTGQTAIVTGAGTGIGEVIARRLTAAGARAIIETRPGEESQVDYGTGPMVRDPDSRKYRRTRLFVLTLGCSRKCVRLLAFRSSARVWATGRHCCLL
jgi:NAD(P)-dependent dehydrogenase (short-subunit alcohol dehydrogenase family)